MMIMTIMIRTSTQLICTLMSATLIELQFEPRKLLNEINNNKKCLWEVSIKHGSLHVLVMHQGKCEIHRNVWYFSITSYSPLVYKSSTARQRSIKNLFKGGSIKENMGHLISKFFIYESVAPYKTNSHYFKKMIIDT